MVKIEIKEATSDNLKYITDLNKQLFDHEYTNFDKTLDCNWPSNNQDYFKKSITSKDSITLVAFAKGRVIGYLIGSIKKASAYRKIKRLAEIDNMFVLPEFRGQGTGSLLCEKFVNWAKKKGVDRIKVVASVNNEKAINFYKENKFKEYDLALEREI